MNVDGTVSQSLLADRRISPRALVCVQNILLAAMQEGRKTKRRRRKVWKSIRYVVFWKQFIMNFSSLSFQYMIREDISCDRAKDDEDLHALFPSRGRKDNSQKQGSVVAKQY